MSRHHSPQRNRLAQALFAALLVPATAAYAQDTSTQDADEAQTTTTTAGQTQAKQLNKVVVTGSLIPQTELETFKPLTIITAEDIQARGFTSVADRGCFGLYADRDALPDVDHLAGHIDTAIDELLDPEGRAEPTVPAFESRGAGYE